MANILIFSLYKPAYKAGGPINSIEYICDILQKQNNIYILSPSKDLDGTLINYKEYWLDKECNVNIIIKDNPNLFFLNTIITKNKIDIVYLNSFFDYRSLILCLMSKIVCDFKMILSPRGQLSDGAMANKPKIKLLYIHIFKLLFSKFVYKYHSTCEEETQEIRKIIRDRDSEITQIPNLRRIPIISDYFEISDKKDKIINIVFFSRIVQKKNLIGVIKNLNCTEFNINLDIYGTLEDLNYWDKCLNEIQKSPKSVVYTYKGSLYPDKILGTLSKYDFFYFPTFGENFGHVILEALYSGIPVVISANTPFTDVVRDYKMGYIVDNNQTIFEVLDIFNNMTNSELLEIKKGILNYLKDLISITKEQEVKYINLFS